MAPRVYLWVHSIAVTTRARQPDPTGEVGRRLGEAIVRTRKALGLTGTDLAARIGIDQSSVSDYERGVAAISVATMLRLDAALALPQGGLLVAAGLVNPDVISTDLRTALLAHPDEDVRKTLMGILALAERQDA
jgi:transcriptional regulator with XRE-family HTH domain